MHAMARQPSGGARAAPGEREGDMPAALPGGAEPEQMQPGCPPARGWPPLALADNGIMHRPGAAICRPSAMVLGSIFVCPNAFAPCLSEIEVCAVLISHFRPMHARCAGRHLLIPLHAWLLSPAMGDIPDGYYLVFVQLRMLRQPSAPRRTTKLSLLQTGMQLDE